MLLIFLHFICITPHKVAPQSSWSTVHELACCGTLPRAALVELTSTRMLPTLPLCPFLFQHPREFSQLRYYIFSGINIEFPNIVQAFCLGSKKQWHQWGLCWTREDSMPNWGWWLDQWGHSRSVYLLVDLSLGLIYNLKPNLCHFNTDLDKTFHFYESGS